MTIRHLLNHTSGIKSYTSVRDFFKTARKDYARREILDLVAKEPLEFAPGEKWSYCNTGYFLLGMVIEKVTGKEYGDFLDERIFKPLGMTQTRANDLRAIIPDRAQGYEWDGKELRNGEYVSPTQPFAAGMLVSSVNDLIKWDAALADGRLLKPSTLEQMWTPTRLNKGKEAEYGFGWQITKVNGHRLVSHGGGIPGFSTELSRFVDDRLTVDRPDQRGRRPCGGARAGDRRPTGAGTGPEAGRADRGCRCTDHRTAQASDARAPEGGGRSRALRGGAEERAGLPPQGRQGPGDPARRVEGVPAPRTEAERSGCASALSGQLRA